MPGKMPPPEYINEPVDGTLVEYEGKPALLIRIDFPGAPVIARGPFVVRYAVSMLFPPTQAVVPGLFLAERGGLLLGREAWNYLQTRFQMHPRADIVGLFLDGSRAEVRLKDLDFGTAVRVFAYRTPADTIPISEIRTLIAPNTEGLPELLLRYLPPMKAVG
jgi:hypothetical protein